VLLVQWHIRPKGPLGDHSPDMLATFVGTKERSAMVTDLAADAAIVVLNAIIQREDVSQKEVFAGRFSNYTNNYP